MGFDVTRYPPLPDTLALRKRLMARFAIDTVLDVGANTGQYALQLRHELGFRGRIVSFEPSAGAYAALSRAAAGDPLWRAVHCALGDEDAEANMHVAGNSVSSSLLDMLPAHEKAAPASTYVGSERITVRRLDGLFDDLCAPGASVYLKIDTQGFERHVLDGAGSALRRVGTLQLELSFRPLYRGELPFHQMVCYLRERHYALIALEPGFADPRSGELLQAEGIFRRSEGSLE